jgi:hypothetical protein
MSVDEMSVDRMYVNEMSVDEISVDKMFAYQMSVDISVVEMSLDEMSVDKMFAYQISVDHMSVVNMSVGEVSLNEDVCRRDMRRQNYNLPSIHATSPINLEFLLWFFYASVRFPIKLMRLVKNKNNYIFKNALAYCTTGL